MISQQSFATSVERLLREAAADPKVLGIKMTLYRTAPNSAIIDSLLQAPTTASRSPW